ncbi:hypothetical protein LDENG_00115750 [Lucifuga dentata]|nr:hypothetical protein LDENG_00115750 [Lucifuga dentata]
MAPLISPPGCVNCSHLADQVAELQRRISMLYQIREAEKQMDTIIFDAGPSSINIPDEPWIQLGAKPKALVGSTPSHDEHWTLVDACSRRGRHSSRVPPSYDIQLEHKNKYDILNLQDFPPLAENSTLPSPSSLLSRGAHSSQSPLIPLTARPEHSSHRARRSTLQFTPAPREAPVPLHPTSSFLMILSLHTS